MYLVYASLRSVTALWHLWCTHALEVIGGVRVIRYISLLMHHCLLLRPTGVCAYRHADCTGQSHNSAVHRMCAQQSSNELLEFCVALPKSELHAHLNGCVRLSTLKELAVAANLPCTRAVCSLAVVPGGCRPITC